MFQEHSHKMLVGQRRAAGLACGIQKDEVMDIKDGGGVSQWLGVQAHCVVGVPDTEA